MSNKSTTPAFLFEDSPGASLRDLTIVDGRLQGSVTLSGTCPRCGHKETISVKQSNATFKNAPCPKCGSDNVRVQVS